MLTRKSSIGSPVGLTALFVLITGLSASAWGAADLSPTIPTGWPAPIVISTIPNTSTDSITNPQYDTDNFLYIDFAVKNIGDQDAGAFRCFIEVDGTVVKEVGVNVLAVNAVFMSKDFKFGPMSRGTHNIRVIIDPTNPPFGPGTVPPLVGMPGTDADGDVTEGNETNNEYLRTITVKYPLPRISSGSAVSKTVGENFTYTITASGNPTSYNTSALPLWLSLNSVTGVISGTPPLSATGKDPTVYNFTVYASNLDFTGSLDVALTVYPVKPIINSPLSATAQLNEPFSYTLTTTGSPADLDMFPSGIAGLVWDPLAHTFSGIPSQVGTIVITMTATNSAGADEKLLQITISGPPVIVGDLSVSGTVGVNFSYQIQAIGYPYYFPNPAPGSIPPMPPAPMPTPTSGLDLSSLGLSLNTSTGIISGTPTTAGTYSVPLLASNGFGTATATLLISIKDGTKPAFTSPLKLYGQRNSQFYYKIGGTERPEFARTLSGTVSSVGTDVSGSGTKFTTELVPNSIINVNGQVRTVSAINNNTSLTTTAAFVPAIPTGSFISQGQTAAQTFSNLVQVSGTPTSPDPAYPFMPLGLKPAEIKTAHADGTITTDFTGEIIGKAQEAGHWRVDVTISYTSSTLGVQFETRTLDIYIEDGTPYITSAQVANGAEDASFFYQIAASFGPTSYTVLFDPFGCVPLTAPIGGTLTYNQTTGIISGSASIPPDLYWATISATNSNGTGSQLIAIAVNSQTSAAVGGDDLTVELGKPFSWAAPGLTGADLPANLAGQPNPFPPPGNPPPCSWNAPLGNIGLGVVGNTISGTPSQVGTFHVRLTNGGGYGYLRLTIVPPGTSVPVITNPSAVIGKTGSPFAFQLAATNSPNSWSVTGLPANLSFDPNTLVISGTVPADVGPTDVLITATNGFGTSQDFHLTMAFYDQDSSRPALASASTATATEGVDFNALIISTQNATSITAVSISNPNAPNLASQGPPNGGLPDGLVLNGPPANSTVTITGQPSIGTASIDNNGIAHRRDYWVMFQMGSANGTGYGIIKITVNPSPPLLQPSPTALANLGLSGGIPELRTLSTSGTSVVGAAFNYLPLTPAITTVNGVPANYYANPGRYYLNSGFSYPRGISLDNTGLTPGLLSGQPSAVNAYQSLLPVEAVEANLATFYPAGADTRSLQVGITPIIITSEILDDAIVNIDYSYQITTEAPAYPYQYGVSGLPAGLTFNASTGTITGRPLVSSATALDPNHRFEIVLTAWNTAYDANPTGQLIKGKTTLALRVSQIPGSPVIQKTYPNTYSGVHTVPLVPYQIVASPAATSYDAIMLDGRPITVLGLSVDTTTGVISGTPNQYGVFDIILKAINGTGPGGTILTLLIDPLKPTISSPVPVFGVVGRPMAIDLFVTGSQSIVMSTNPPPAADALPAGLTLNGYQIQGTPTQAGTPIGNVTPPTNTTIIASGPKDSDQKIQQITIYRLPTIPGGITINGTIGVPITPVSFNVTGSPESMEAALSQFPGLTYSTNTVGMTTTVTVSGTPTSTTPPAGVSLSITATNIANIVAVLPAVTGALTVKIAPMVISNSPLLITGTKGVAITPFILKANGNPNSFSASGLPLALTINTGNGTITGVPAVAGTFQATVTASNGIGNASGTLIIAISEVPGSPAITSPLQAASALGQPFFYQISATNMPTPTPPGSFNAVPLAPAPSLDSLGLSVDSATGVISGVPILAGSFSIQLSATNSIGTGSAVLTFGVATTPNGPAIVSPLTAQGMVGQGFSYQIISTVNPVSFGATVNGNQLSAIGLTLDSVSGLISGIPTQSGTFVVRLTAGSGFADLTLTILPSQNPVINSASTHTGTVGVPLFPYVITATALPTSFGATNLPPGLSVDTSTGLISGTPLLAGAYPAVLSATNSSGTGTKTVVFNIDVAAGAPAITSPVFVDGTVGGAFSYQITGTLSPTSFDAVGLVLPGNIVTPLPFGFTVNTATGLITGTPNAIGIYNFIVLATNAAGTGSALVTLNVVSTIPVVTSPTSVSGNVGIPLIYQITAQGIQPITFTVANLPPGLTLSGSIISGNPTTEGVFVATISATNSVATLPYDVTFTIGPPIPPSFASASSVLALTQVGFNFNVVINGSQPFTLTATGLPPGLILAGTLITGVPTQLGSFPVTLTATNIAGTTTQTLIITVSGIAPNIDTDGDGFPDELEFFLGTDPLNANSTPFRGAPANADPFHLSAKLSVKLDFINIEKDMVTLTGSLPLPAGFTSPGQRMVVDIGGVIKVATLDSRGSFMSSDKKTILKLNAKTSRAGGVNARYSVKLRGTFRSQLSDEELTNIPANKSARDVILIVLVGEIAYQKTTTVLYTCKKNKGSAK